MNTFTEPVTNADIQVRSDKFFAMLDKDGNGEIDEAEFMSVYKEQAGANFNEADGKREWTMFLAHTDTNGDRKIDR